MGPARGTEAFQHPFALDPFQLEAGQAIARDENVLVSAPTGSGKTVVAEMAVNRALATGRRCFYTAPIKALSNQKFNDLTATMGEGRVGLLTGDHSINPDAPVVVMTTEVLRNMVYSDSATLGELGWVVLDEVHFLADAYRGPVWEEVLIHTPPEVRFVCLSATVSNAAELGDWIRGLRGPTTTVIEHRRPVQLDSVLMVGDKVTHENHLVALLRNGRPNPEGRHFDVDRSGQPGGSDHRGGPSRSDRGGFRHRGRPRTRYRTPRRNEVVEELRAHQLLPAIYFIFSRNGCDDAAARCASLGPVLTTSAERGRIREIVGDHTSSLGREDLEVLRFESWLHTLEAGFAAHHAGMVPAFKEAVELCFTEGLIKVVFATETLALGINMPARSVVIEKLSKFNGETHEPVGPGLYTQLTGRAGRRGIDDQGHAIVLWTPFATFDQIAQLAASREFPLESSFRPNYNMAANLVGRYDREHAFQVLERSFAQFHLERHGSILQQRRSQISDDIERQLTVLTSEATMSPAGAAIFDVESYVDLLAQMERERKERSRRRVDIERFLAGLRPGDVVEIDAAAGDRGDRCVIISSAQRRGGRVRLTAIDTDGNRFQIAFDSDWADAHHVGSVDLPVPYLPRDADFRSAAAQALRRMNPRRTTNPHSRTGSRRRDGTPVGLGEIRARLMEHPLHAHPDRDRLVEEYRVVGDLRAELAGVDRELERTAGTLASQLEATLAVLGRTAHLDGWMLTAAGLRLRRIFHQSDLLISMAVEEGLLDDLEPAELAAMVSCITYEHRSREPAPEPVIPTAALRERFAGLSALWKRLAGLERSARVGATAEPQGGFMSTAWSWASGHELSLLIDEDLSGGDFVRNMRQVMDMLEQLAGVTPNPATERSARAAAEAVRRGIITSAGGTL